MDEIIAATAQAVVTDPIRTLLAFALICAGYVILTLWREIKRLQSVMESQMIASLKATRERLWLLETQIRGPNPHQDSPLQFSDSSASGTRERRG